MINTVAMRKLCLSIVALALALTLKALPNDGAIDHQRDSLLKVITGARLQTEVVSILKFGAKAGGVKDCKQAFDKAMAWAARRGGARIVVPQGEYLIKGPIHFVSNVTLELQQGAVLNFDATPELYLPMVRTSWEGTFVYNYSPFIYGYELTDVAIVGQGSINGNAGSTFSTWRKQQNDDKLVSRAYNHDETPYEERRFGEGHKLRPQLIQFYKCKGVTMEGVFITNAPFWCVHLLMSENIICRGLRYDAKLVNNDGIDPEYSRNILIEDIDFDNGDDNVAIKAGRDNDGRNTAVPSENIIIRNCRFKGLHAVVLGSEMSAGVQNVFVENCTFGGYCKRGFYIKTNPDRGGFIRNIYVRNCTFDEVEDLIYVTSMYAGEGQDNVHFTDVHDVYVDNVTCRKARNAAVVLQGTPAKPLRNMRFENIEVGESAVGLSMMNTDDIVFRNCNLGGRVGVPSLAK